MAYITTHSASTTYMIDDGEVVTITRHEPDVWPDHRLDRILTADEHGYTLMACNRHEGWVGTVIESAEHVAAQR